MMLILKASSEALTALIGNVGFIYFLTIVMNVCLHFSQAGVAGLSAFAKRAMGVHIIVLVVFASTMELDVIAVVLIALPLLAYTMWNLAATIRAPFDGGDPLARFIRPFAPDRMTHLIVAELRLLGLALFRWGKAKRDPEKQSFTSGSVLAPVLLAVATLSVVEMAVMHLILVQWSSMAAWIATSVGLFCFLYMIGLAKSLRYRPTMLAQREIVIRLGHFQEFRFSYELIESVKPCVVANPKDKHTLNLALMSAPNVLLHLKEERPLDGPFGKSRAVRDIALRMDDDKAFVSALDARLSEYRHRASRASLSEA